jgi:hypothetical protein
MYDCDAADRTRYFSYRGVAAGASSFASLVPHDELQRLAVRLLRREHAGQTLAPTDLIHLSSSGSSYAREAPSTSVVG